ncbi:hypothetical protein QBC43DRAFT_351029 [Cladorrhinum sp. PSN259]|nr:hypothetical protein QBC43DRAFT_351029 [Cladorrhinum sp. PSN259]
MEPLEALSLAGTIITFVQFAVQLCNGVKQISESLSGASESADSLKDVCSTLVGFMSGLQLTEQGGLHKSLPPHEVKLRSLAKARQADCEKLLGILRDLNIKTRSGPGWWRSFQVAFLEAAKSGDIKALKERIDGYQGVMEMIFLDLTNKSIVAGRAEVGKLRLETNTTQLQLLQDLHNLEDKLEKLGQSIKDMLLDHYSSGDSPTQAFFNQRTAEIMALHRETQILACEQALLFSLDFQDRCARHEGIGVSYPKTFSWVLTPTPADTATATSESSKPPDPGRLMRWLETGAGIFWISGKPGSGKSTFMKFLCNESRTYETLRTWAGRKSLLAASHYFWATGSALQRSYEGLLRSLLYSILNHSPGIIDKIFPERWHRTMSALVNGTTSSSAREPWLLSELVAALRKVRELPELPFKCCFFIDGLDEYKGDKDSLCEALRELASHPCIKLCVASRPWNIFEEKFGTEESLKIYVHEFTEDDIRLYAEGRLRGHARWAQLAVDNKVNATELLAEITKRAKGVFLWVFLVTRLLREGMTNYDTIADLQKRLNTIPEDLEQFFKQILSSVEPFYHDKMEGTLQLALTAQGPMDSEVYLFHDLEYEDGPNYYLKHKVEPWTMNEWYDFKKPFPWRLSSRCKGLLEINRGKVEFLHRTVRDFLRTAEMTSFIAGYARADSDPDISITKSYIAWIKHLDCREDLPQGYCRVDLPMDKIDPMVVRALGHISHAYERAHQPSETAALDSIIDHIEWCLCTMRENIAGGPTLESPALVFRTYIIRTHLSHYICTKLDLDCAHFDKLDPPALSTILCYNGILAWTDARFAVLRSLLLHGHDPNEPNYAHPSLASPWREFTLKMSASSATTVLLPPIVKAGIIPMLLEFGAGPAAAAGLSFDR